MLITLAGTATALAGVVAVLIGRAKRVEFIPIRVRVRQSNRRR